MKISADSAGDSAIPLAQLLRARARSLSPDVFASVSGEDEARSREEQLHAVLAKAQAEGYAAGMARAEEMISKAQDEARAGATESLRHAELVCTEKERYLQELINAIEQSLAFTEEQMLGMASGIALAALSRLIGQRYAAAAPIASLCLQALQECRTRPAVLRVSPLDMNFLTDLQLPASVKLKEADELGRGSCQVSTVRGIYETSLETRISALVEIFQAHTEVNKGVAA